MLPQNAKRYAQLDNTRKTQYEVMGRAPRMLQYKLPVI